MKTVSMLVLGLIIGSVGCAGKTTYYVKGDKGDTGAQGETGPAGPQGATGPQGPMGAQGIVGPQGPIGLTGEQGVQGIPGLQGPEGPVGATGVQGVQGIPGLDGADGEPGQDGSNGVDGVNGHDGSSITTIKFCNDDTSTFPEYGVVIGQNIYAVYWGTVPFSPHQNQAFLTLIRPGTYVSTGGNGCAFTVLSDGQIQ